MKPIVIIPGFGGSVLVNKLCKHKTIFGQPVIDNRWMNIAPFSKSNMDRWKDDMYVELKREISSHHVTGYKNYDTNIVVYDNIGTRGLTNIVPELDLLSKSYQDILQRNFHYKYLGAMVECFTHHGYKEKQSIYGVPYDFRLILDDVVRNEFFGRVKYVMERALRKNREPCVLITHSLGGVLFKWFASSFVDDAWLATHLHKWFCLSAPFGGTPLALRILFSGEYYVPMFNHMFKDPLRKNGGIIMCIPNSLAFDLDDVFLDIENPEKQIRLGDYHKLALNNNASFVIWRDLYEPSIGKIAKPVRLPVDVIYTTKVETPNWYKIKNNGDSPYKTRYGEGDGQVVKTSLEAADKLFLGHEKSVDIFDRRDHIDIIEDERLFHRILSSTR
jgi:hypothetical protein